MDYLFIACLAVWTVFSLLRFVYMYEPTSIFQRWRKWDWFHLIPVGAFFSPKVPQTEFWILFRDFLPDRQITEWTEDPRIRPRTFRHVIWNPQKHLYRAKFDAAHSLLSAAGTLPDNMEALPVKFLLSEPYLALILYITDLPRCSKPQAIQFAVIETDILTRQVVRTVVSSIHEV